MDDCCLDFFSLDSCDILEVKLSIIFFLIPLFILFYFFFNVLLPSPWKRTSLQKSSLIFWIVCIYSVLVGFMVSVIPSITSTSLHLYFFTYSGKIMQSIAFLIISRQIIYFSAMMKDKISIFFYIIIIILEKIFYFIFFGLIYFLITFCSRKYSYLTYIFAFYSNMFDIFIRTLFILISSYTFLFIQK